MRLWQHAGNVEGGTFRQNTIVKKDAGDVGICLIWQRVLTQAAFGIFALPYLQKRYDVAQRMTKTSTKFRKRGFAAYRTYVADLKNLAGDSRRADDWDERAVAALNGQASVELRRVIPLKTRRRVGAFFTGSELAARFISRCSKFDKRSIIHDPSMGMGDLLLFDAERLRILVERHLLHTGSPRAKEILDNWTTSLGKFVKVMPLDYAKALADMKARSAMAAE